jgi:hypothetical protein
MRGVASTVLGWGLIALWLGACAAMYDAPPGGSAAPQARCSNLGAPRSVPGAITSSGSPIRCE